MKDDTMRKTLLLRANSKQARLEFLEECCIKHRVARICPGCSELSRLLEHSGVKRAAQ